LIAFGQEAGDLDVVERDRSTSGCPPEHLDEKPMRAFNRRIVPEGCATQSVLADPRKDLDRLISTEDARRRKLQSLGDRAISIGGEDVIDPERRSQYFPTPSALAVKWK
jgi:hypothetical protein